MDYLPSEAYVFRERCVLAATAFILYPLATRRVHTVYLGSVLCASPIAGIGSVAVNNVARSG